MMLMNDDVSNGERGLPGRAGLVLDWSPFLLWVTGRAQGQ